ncbi:MAG TPA: hypothetical protein VG265_16065 [Gaiellaceae bacterium]|nr:hypothetical protein [Gaiellaceae bacterium]
MARFDIAGGLLILRLTPFEQIGGFVRGNAEVPLTAVRRARATDSPWDELRGVRMPGTGRPRRKAVGSWRFPGGKDFVALHGRGPAVIVELAGLEYSRLLVSTENAEEVAAQIDAAAEESRAGDETAFRSSHPAMP